MRTIHPLPIRSGRNEISPRLDLHDSAPHSMEELISFQEFIGTRTFESVFLDLVRAYVSQLNRCAYGIARYSRRARSLGESEERLRLLLSWRQSTLYSERERAALAWAECLTRALPKVQDSEFQQVREWFTQEELVDLSCVIVETQAWNRLATTFRQVA